MARVHTEDCLSDKEIMLMFADTAADISAIRESQATVVSGLTNVATAVNELKHDGKRLRQAENAIVSLRTTLFVSGGIISTVFGLAIAALKFL